MVYSVNSRKQQITEDDLSKTHVHRDHASVNYVAASILLSAMIIGSSVIYASIQLSGALSLTNRTTTQQAGQQQNSTTPLGKANIADRANQPMMGNKDAKVTIVEFGDFQCPYCKQFFQTTYNELKSKYIDTGKVKWVFRHLPLTRIHDKAQISAIAGECANKQGKFWEMHNLMFQNGKSDGTGLDVASLKKYADTLGLNSVKSGTTKNQFNQCLDSQATLGDVQIDQNEANKWGVSGTPYFLVNGTRINGAETFVTFQAAIEAAMK